MVIDIFEDGVKSYGYFNGNGSDIPFKKGLVLSTWNLKHGPDPDTSQRDDDAKGWAGIETWNIASEEYQEGDDTTRRYSDQCDPKTNGLAFFNFFKAEPSIINSQI